MAGGTMMTNGFKKLSKVGKPKNGWSVSWSVSTDVAVKWIKKLLKKWRQKDVGKN